MLHLLTPLLLPFACSWIEKQQRMVLAQGLPLTPSERTDAISIGVLFPDKVRLLCIGRIALPNNRLIRMCARATGLLSTEPAGLAAGYGILVRERHWRARPLISHELVHVMQYERLGGVRPFLRAYLNECLRFGYASAPLELEALEIAGRFFGEPPTERP